jgi:hypothetical protein
MMKGQMLSSSFLLIRSAQAEPRTLGEYCAAFVPRNNWDKEEQKAVDPPTEYARNLFWGAQYMDLFSPDTACKDSIRIVEIGDFNQSSYGTDKGRDALHVSANATGKGCSESWGRAFTPMDVVDPIMKTYMNYDGPCIPENCWVGYYEAKISFASKITNKSDPNYAYAQKGALDFIVRLGSVGPQGILWNNVLAWSGMYNGKGGPFFDHQQGKVIQAPALTCGNIWKQVALNPHPHSAYKGPAEKMVPETKYV